MYPSLGGPGGGPQGLASQLGQLRVGDAAPGTAAAGAASYPPPPGPPASSNYPTGNPYASLDAGGGGGGGGGHYPSLLPSSSPASTGAPPPAGYPPLQPPGGGAGYPALPGGGGGGSASAPPAPGAGGGGYYPSLAASSGAHAPASAPPPAYQQQPPAYQQQPPAYQQQPPPYQQQQPGAPHAAGGAGGYGPSGSFGPSSSFGPSGSFGSAAPPATPPAAAPAAAAAAPAAPQSGAWVLKAPLPQEPAQQIIGPFVRFNDYDPATGRYDASILVVAHPRLEGSTVQVHYGAGGPPSTPAPASLLDNYMGYRFLRYDVTATLGEAPSVLEYTVGLAGAQAPLARHAVQLPARGEQWRWLFHSCNGFHEREPEAKYGGIAHLWGDLLERHAVVRFHVQVGGGDQIYCDDVWSLPAVLPWVAIDDPHVRAKGAFTPAMLTEVEQFYFGHYAAHFSEPRFARAMAEVPYVFSWDDHDIFDGWGSYPPYLQQSAVFQGVFAVARRFFLLFQMHANYTSAPTASRTMGSLAYHQVRSFGPSTLLLAPDTRSHRTETQVVPRADWDAMFAEAERRLAAGRGAVRHVVVMLGVPILYPKIPVAESAVAGISGALARSSEMRAALRRANLPGGTVNQFMEADLLDDLKDHWTAADHIKEKEFLVRRLQELSARHSVRVTLISGDVHVGAYGCLQGHPKVADRVVDPKFMLQVVSSAIGNEPPPAGVVVALETSSMATTQLQDTLEKMIRAFPGRKKLWQGRNYCEVFPLDTPFTEPSTGIPQPPGGLMFALRCETGTPGAWGPVEAHWQVAPLLLPQGNPQAAQTALPGGYAAQHPHMSAAAAAAGGLVGQVAGLLPGQTGAKLQGEVKKLGHKLGNFLQKF